MDRRLGKKLAEWADQSATAGMKFELGTYVGIVKLNVDPMRLGRLKVWLPDGGGDEDNPRNWRWVTYASPFYGTTQQTNRNKENSYIQSESVYGMWAVPPDVGNSVLCTFINGDPGRGYWFAVATTTNLSHNGVPGVVTRLTDGTIEKDTVISDLVKSSLSRTDFKSYLPTAEFNEDREDKLGGDFISNSLPVNEFQAEILIKQGLDTDPVRGTTLSSSMRDVPGSVFGISTPGKELNISKLTNDPSKKTKEKDEGKIKSSDPTTPALRTGGHSFVMDDGSNDADALIRLRTSGGHQLLMNDNAEIIYIANKNGHSWLEFTNSGAIQMYSKDGFAVRTKGTLDLHSDRSVNIQGATVNIRAESSIHTSSKNFISRASNESTIWGGKVGIGSSGAITVNGAGTVGVASGSSLILKGNHINLNDAGVDAVADPGEIKLNSFDDAVTTGSKAWEKLWTVEKNALKSIVTVAPTHEPYGRGTAGVPTDYTEPRTQYVCVNEQLNKPKTGKVPPGGAGPFADFIAGHESGSAGYNAFNRGSNPPRGTGTVGGEKIDLVNMTISEILSKRASAEPDPRARLFAVGRYQVIPDTLTAACSSLGIPQSSKFTAEVQDNIFVNYLCKKKQPKINAYLSGSDPDNEGALLNACSATAGEWASIEDPLLNPPRGRYDGVGTNRAHGKTAETKAALKAQWKYLKDQAGAVTSGSGNTVTDGSGNPIGTGEQSTNAGIVAAQGQAVVKGAPDSYMNKEDAPNTGVNITGSGEPPAPGQKPAGNYISGLDSTQCKALLVQIAFAETDSNPSFNTGGRIGRYGVNAIILCSYDYIKSDYLRSYKADAINKREAWTGKDNINSLSDFLNSVSIQDKVMSTFIVDVYGKLNRTTPRGIDFGDDPCQVAGMIAVAYLYKDKTQFIGSDVWAMAQEAAAWRTKNNTASVNGVTPAQAYNQGRHAIDVLSSAKPPVTTPIGNTAGAGEPSGSGIEPNTVITFTSGSGDLAHYMQMGTGVRRNMELMAKEFMDATRRKITLNSAYRSLEEQQAIYDKWVAAGGSPSRPSAGGFYMPSKPAPTSPHLRKIAFDISRQDIADLNRLGLLQKYGFKFPFPDADPVHIQVA